MYKRIIAKNISDLMKPMNMRPNEPGVYFARLCTDAPQIRTVLWAYYEAARQKGVIIDGQITNPDERQLGYMAEVMGTAFQPDATFIEQALQKWMPRMKPENRKSFALLLSQQFTELRQKGKTDSILRNIYMKIMCWLYYRFERLMPFLGDQDLPRILYLTQGITAHELILLRILSAMGADILLVEPCGDEAYLKQDSLNSYAQLLSIPGNCFSSGFTLKQFAKDMMNQTPTKPVNPVYPRMTIPSPVATRPPVQPSAPIIHAPREPESYFPKPTLSACTNAWMKAPSFEQLLTPPNQRMNEPDLFCNAYIRMVGVEDKTTYPNQLFQLYQKLKVTGRNIVIVDEGLTMPTPEEVEKIRRRPYRTPEELIIDLAGNLPANANVELQRLMQQAFVRTMKGMMKLESNLNKLTTGAVYLLCWIQRYQAGLFQGYKSGMTPVFILLGACQNQHDALYLKYLSQLPVDVLLLVPDKTRQCSLQDDRLLDVQRDESMILPRFPRDAGSLQIRTLASNAEQELTQVLYADSGIYRNRQFTHAETITLQTTFDEIFILWNKELKYRQHFDTVNQVVNIPVLYAKVSGTELGKTEAYWQKIKLLLGDNVKLYTGLPCKSASNPGQYQSIALKTVKNGKLLREEIKANRQYPYGMLREEMQEHMLDKIQTMLDQRIIKGTFVNGTEYTVVATVLGLEKELIRMLQSFDFTKRNPKVVVIATDEKGGTPEDAILLTFLNLAGFDVVQFVPTGYQTIERYLNINHPVEHQIGDYIYDLSVPDFNTLPPMKNRSWFENILKRGN